jgi:hypothetical protein
VAALKPGTLNRTRTHRPIGAQVRMVYTIRAWVPPRHLHHPGTHRLPACAVALSILPVPQLWPLPPGVNRYPLTRAGSALGCDASMLLRGPVDPPPQGCNDLPIG